MASKAILKKIHELIKQGWPNTTDVHIDVSVSGMNVDARYAEGIKCYRNKSITGKPVDVVEEEEE